VDGAGRDFPAPVPLEIADGREGEAFGLFPAGLFVGQLVEGFRVVYGIFDYLLCLDGLDLRGGCLRSGHFLRGGHRFRLRLYGADRGYSLGKAGRDVPGNLFLDGKNHLWLRCFRDGRNSCPRSLCN